MSTIDSESALIATLEIPRLQWDIRLGGQPQLIFATDAELMQIPDPIRKCVGFLGFQAKESRVLGGTVFFLGVPVADTVQIAYYAVTARHVIEEIDARDVDDMTYFRLNHKQRGAEFIACPLDRWIFPEEGGVDVAIAPIDLPFDEYDHGALSLNLFLTNAVIMSEMIGPGDDLFFPGLFKSRPGERVNIPVMRTGTIASMPSEPVRTKWGLVRSAYLAETRSIGGLSGSPVFVHLASGRAISGGTRFPHAAGPVVAFTRSRFYLLGLVHGHYKGSRDITAFDFLDEAREDSGDDESINAGIGIIVAAGEITKLLNHPTLIAQRGHLHLKFVVESESRLPEPDARTGDATPES